MNHKTLLKGLVCSSLLLCGSLTDLDQLQPVLAAEESIAHSGKLGTARWAISTDGVLTISSGEFKNNDKEYWWPWREYLGSVREIRCEEGFKVIGTLQGFFWNASYTPNKSIKSVDLNGLDLSETTDLRSMFNGCGALTDVKISDLDTSTITDMSGLFFDCLSLENVDLSTWDTSSVTNLYGMFNNCSSLKSVNITGWDTSKVTNMSYMFYGCPELETLSASHLDTGAVTDMSYMFNGDTKLSTFDPSGWNTSKVTDMSLMFYECKGLKEMPVANWDTSSVTDMRLMFYGCSGLRDLAIGGWDTGKVENISWMFSGCEKLQSLDIGNWNTASMREMWSTFYGCPSLQRLDLAHWNTSAVTNMGWLFSANPSLTFLDLSQWNTANVTDFTGTFTNSTALEEIRYPQSASALIHHLADPNGWFFNGTGPYEAEKLPEVPQGVVATISKERPKGYLSDLGNGQVSGYEKPFTATGEALVPSPVIKVGGVILQEGIDYTLSFADNINPGTASVTVTGIGPYTGTLQTSFVIEEEGTKPSLISIDQAAVSGVDAEYPFTGQAITPKPVVVLNDSVLEEGTDYSLLYSGNVQPGTAIVQISGIGRYNSQKEISFTILPAVQKPEITSIDDAQISNIESEYLYTGQAIVPNPVVTVNGRTLEKDIDYILTCVNNVNPGNASLLIEGKGNYAGRIACPFTILPVQPEPEILSLRHTKIENVKAEYAYTGKPVMPEPALRLGDILLRRDVDYTVTYSNPVGPGNATLTVTGIGKYTDSVSTSYIIKKAAEPVPAPISLASASITGISSRYLYTGNPITPKPVVKIGSSTLVEGRDYTLSYSDNNKPGKGVLIITGKGNYTGTVRKEFDIVKSSSSVPIPVTVKSIPMHRLYNPNSGEHFYTADGNEKNHLVQVGWKYEGEGWKAPEMSSVPVFRLYNANAGDHHYTLNPAEKDHLVKVGWKYEGIGWYSDEARSVPLYRQYNPNAKAGSHNYTTSQVENDHLVKVGWKPEGIGWYGLKK